MTHIILIEPNLIEGETNKAFTLFFTLFSRHFSSFSRPIVVILVQEFGFYCERDSDEY